MHSAITAGLLAAGGVPPAGVADITFPWESTSTSIMTLPRGFPLAPTSPYDDMDQPLPIFAPGVTPFDGLEELPPSCDDCAPVLFPVELSGRAVNALLTLVLIFLALAFSFSSSFLRGVAGLTDSGLTV